jgi:hypothetical protein
MVSSRLNALDQALDIAGSLTQSSSYTLADEPNGLGAVLSGQTGSAANITTVGGGLATVTGLTGMSASSVGRFLTISGAASSGNNGTFLIAAFISSSSVQVANASAVASDANNGSISWSERNPYSLEDDLNFVRTDRAAIKGVAFSAAIPTYQRPTAVGTLVPANLSNIAGKTTDAKAIVINRQFASVSVAVSDGYITLTDAGNLKHADATDRTGVPIQDGADAGNYEATYVEIIDPTTEAALEVLGGANDGYRVFGRTRAGTTGTSPNSVEVEFRAVPKGSPLSSSVSYTWEAGQPTTVNMFYGFRERLDNLTETALRTVLTNGIIGDADMAQDVTDIRTTIGISDNVTDLAGLLTNTSNFYAFVNLPDVTPSVVEALNTLNEQIGDRDYSGPYLSDGETVTASLQALSNAISGSSAVRTIERLNSDINAGTAHTIPGSQSYTQDGGNNGQNMWVFVRGVLKDPGPVTAFNDYEETSTTSITFYTKVKSGDHINYVIYA